MRVTRKAKQTMMTPKLDKETREIFERAIVIDGLNVSNWDSPSVYESLHLGGVTAINATVAQWENYHDTLDNIAAWLPRFSHYSDTIIPCTNVEGIMTAKREGVTGIILGFQNASPIENNLDRLMVFHRLGVRIIQITYHEANLLGSGCFERHDYGLTNFGVDAVKEMNRLGILIDLSHVGSQTTMETIEMSEKPVSVTHANLKSHLDMPRNKDFDAIKLMTERGGVIGATCINSMLREGKKATKEDYIDVIDDMVEKFGIDHVGIGTDFTQDQTESFWRYSSSQQGTKFPLKIIADQGIYPDEMTDLAKQRYYPVGLETPDQFPTIASLLLGKGYKPEDVAKVVGGNWLRLFNEVWSD